MSTIYDALKKIESKSKPEDEKPGAPKRNNPRQFLLIYAVCALIIIALIHFLTVKSSQDPARAKRTSRALRSPASTPVPSRPQPISEKQTPSSLVKKLPTLYLTGIFLIGGEYMALINDQTVRVGDSIEDTQIQKIEPNGVEIEFDGSSFRINYP